MPVRIGVLHCWVLILAAIAAADSGPVPLYWPTCDSPQNIGLLQPMGGKNVVPRTSVMWNGLDYAAVWPDNNGGLLAFRRFFADGTPAGPAVAPSAMGAYVVYPAGLVWNGNGYGVAWSAWTGSAYIAHFMRLDANGALIGTETRVAFVGATPTATSFNVGLAWNGTTYCVVWDDVRGGTQDVYATLLNADGTVAGAGTLHDIMMNTVTSGLQQLPSVAWNPSGNAFEVVWQDARLAPQQVYGRLLTPVGTFGTEIQLTASTSQAGYPNIAASTAAAAVVWRDFRDGNNEVYFALLGSNGARYSLETRLTNTSTPADPPFIVWTGAEWGVFWSENINLTGDIWFTRVGPTGQLYSTLYQVTYTAGSFWPAAAFGRYDYLVTLASAGSYANYLEPWGCQWDYTPPSCPPNLLAYSVTGTSATVSWAPSVEDLSDIAYYQVYRNNTPIAKTSANYYADTGLALGTTYNYFVRPVNAAELENGACASSIYVKTNASLMLTLTKNANDAHLSWTDGGISSYNVFRGTNPQVMGQIGSTTQLQEDDPNVLLDGVAYFYTVDDPGW